MMTMYGTEKSASGNYNQLNSPPRVASFILGKPFSAMYKRHEAAAIKQKFWTLFGQYMKPVPSAWNEEVNWVNYHTGVKGIFFRMDAERNFASCRVEVMHKNDALRLQLFHYFGQLTHLFNVHAGEGWIWEPTVHDETGRSLSRISKTIEQVNVLNEQDWPPIISFFKPQMQALDAFWAEAKDGFEMLLWNAAG
jgi:hypothetical protein